MPCIFLVQYCFMTIGVKLGDKTSPRFSTIVGVTIMISSYLILIFFKNYYLVLLGMGIFGLGDGLGNLSAIKNAWKYFPNNKGLVNGIIIGGLGLSSSFFTPLADFIINKEGVKTGDDGFYSKDIADRLIYFLYAMIGIFGFLGFFAIAFTFPFNDKGEVLEKEGFKDGVFLRNEKEKLIQDWEKEQYGNEIQNEEKDKNDYDETNETNNNNVNNNDNNNNNNDNNNDNNIIDKENFDEESIMEAICSFKNLELGIFCFAGPGKNKIKYNIFKKKNKKKNIKKIKKNSFLFPNLKHKQNLRSSNKTK